MENLPEWLGLVARWFHIVVAIGWIGSSFYFMWLDSALERSSDPKVQGQLWMVHSGGFYRVEKRVLSPGEIPPNLHWFKWEALLTWISGIFLLGIVYYWGGLMEERSDTKPLGYAAVGVTAITMSWFVYDRLWLLLHHRPRLCLLVSVCLVCALTWVGTRFLGARASFMHIGAALGTIMVANVWLRILPFQRQMIARTQSGHAPDLQLAELAKRRSVHNNYMTFPVIFIMISHHFPSTYGHEHNWIVLMALFFASVCVRHYLNTHRHVWLLGVAVFVLSFLVWFTQ